MSNMSSLTTALSALYAQRRGLDVTGHNIANANTEGYTRQRVNMVANAGPLSPAVFSQWNGVGQGVDVTGITRMRDAFLDLRSNQEHSAQGELTMTQTILSRIELGFGEPSDIGLAAQFSEFWTGWDDVANNPTDLAARNALLERASTLTTNIRGTAASLSALQTDLTDQLRAQVEAVNQMASSIAQLNENITNQTNAGLSPTDLLDQRDLLINKLSDTIGITVKPKEGGGVDVFVGGTALVRDTVAEALKVGDSTDPVGLQWVKDGYPASATGGSVSGLLKGINDVIPRYLTQLDGVALRTMEMVNAAHAEGQDLDGAPGQDFFTGTGAADMRLSDAVLGTPRAIAAAASGGGGADGSNALRLAGLANHRDRPLDPSDPAYLAGDGPDLLYRSLIVGLGVETEAVNRRADIQYEITRQMDAARDSQAGVNLDEEMTNMLAYQRAYDAAARFMTAIDQMLDRLVNSTGLVGR
jgi:flagellar hook-associated protein 1 FlgK